MATNDDVRSVMSDISISHSPADSEGGRSPEQGDCVNRELSQTKYQLQRTEVLPQETVLAVGERGKHATTNNKFL